METLLTEYESLRTQASEAVKNFKIVGYKGCNVADLKQGKAYQNLVKAGLALQIRSKYRGNQIFGVKKVKNGPTNDPVIENCYPCKPHEFQDSTYSKNKRVKTVMRGEKGKIKGYRCTVCLNTRLI